MTDHKIGTREEWLAARLELLKAEKALTRRSDELAQWRQRLPSSSWISAGLAAARRARNASGGACFAAHSMKLPTTESGVTPSAAASAYPNP